MKIWKFAVEFATLGRVQNANAAMNPEQPDVPRPAPIPTPDNPPWNSWIALAVWGMSVLFVLFIPLVFVIPYVLQQNIGLADSVRLQDFLRTDPTAIVLQLVPVIVVHALTFALGWFVVTRFRTYPFRQTVGWNMNGFKVWHAVAITVLFFGIAAALTYALGEVDNDFERMIKSSRYAVYLIAFLATFTAPLAEEVVYRGLLYSSFQRAFGVIPAVLFVTFLFTAVHVPQYSLSAVPDHATVVALFLLSLTITTLRAVTGNLLPCIVLHTVFNGIQSGVLLASPYFEKVDPVVEPALSLLFK